MWLFECYSNLQEYELTWGFQHLFQSYPLEIEWAEQLKMLELCW